MNKEDVKSIVKLIADGEKMIMMRDTVPKDSVGISIVFGEYETHATLRGEEHKEFLIHLTDVLEAERIAIAQQKELEMK